MTVKQNTASVQNTFRLTAQCSQLALLDHAEQLPNLFIQSQNYSSPALVLGYASNVILPDYYPGLVILNRIMGIDIITESSTRVQIAVGAGEVWHDLVEKALAQGWYGLENLALIPGSVGAAPVQNIGAYGIDLSMFMVRCDVYCRYTGKFTSLSSSDCQFGYRSSLFKLSEKNRYVITKVHLALSKVPQVSDEFPRLNRYLNANKMAAAIPENIFAAVCAIRQSRLPDVNHVGTVGSFFVHPILDSETFFDLKRSCHVNFDYYELPDGRYKLFVGNLLTILGWRGYRCGQFIVSEINPIVLIHRGSGSVSDLMRLVAQLQASVLNVFGVKLNPEPEIVSIFSEAGQR